MSEILNAELAIQRLKENEQRLDIFVNEEGHYDTNTDPSVEVETILSFLLRKETELNNFGAVAEGETTVTDEAGLLAALASGAVTSVNLISSFAMTQDITVDKPFRVRPGETIDTTGWTLNIHDFFNAGFRQVFEGTGTVNFSYGSVKSIPALWFGAFGDGVATDNDIPINKAITAANGRVPVGLFPGTYLCSGDIPLDKPLTYLRAQTPGFIYGPTGSATVLKFTAGTVGISGYDSTPTAVAYSTLENITVDGNSVLDYGFDGGFFNQLLDCTFINCNEAGARIKNGQFTTLRRCGFNGNQDGLYTETTPGTLNIEGCVFRENTRYGVNLTGEGGLVRFSNINVIESNGSYGLVIDGSFVNVTSDTTYYEANNGDSGYHQSINITPFAAQNTGIVFFNDYYSTVGTTAVATIASGNVTYQDCSLVAPSTTVPVEITGVAEVTFNDSFSGYADVGDVKVLPETVRIDPITGINFEALGYLDLTALTLSFGTGDFTVSTIISPVDNTQTSRTVLAGATGGLTIGIVGDASAMSVIALSKQGSAAFNTTTVPMRNNTPYLITYVRASSVGYLYVNGIQVDTFADANNYTGDQGYIGSDTVNPGMVKMYGMSFWSSALTASHVFNLWRYGGNPLAAALGTNLMLNLKTDSRPATKVYESVSAGWLNFQGSAVWLSPMSPAS